MPNRTSVSIAWLGGLLEGEGWFGLAKGQKYPIIALQMTDRDTVERAAQLLGVKVSNHVETRENCKPAFKCESNGRRAIGWMMTLYQFLGERRQAKVREILDEWKAMPGYTKAPRGHQTQAKCHPEKKNEADGLCHTCYMRKYRSHGRKGLRTGAWA